MKLNATVFLLVGALTLPGLAYAQGHAAHHGQGQQAMMPQGQQGSMMREGCEPGMMMGMMGMGMMHGPGPAAILQQKEALSLAEAQVERLQALATRVAEARESHVTQVAPLRQQAMEAMQGDQPDLTRYQTALEKLAEHHVAMQVEMARAAADAMAVLAPEQRSNVRYGMHLMREMMGAGPMGGGMMGGGGMMQGGMMQGGMMRGAMLGGGMMMGSTGCPMQNTMTEKEQG